MKIRTTLTLQYAGLTAAVFFVLVMAVYYVSEHSRSNAFFRNLQSEAITKAHLFLKNQVDAKTMQSIYLNNQKFIDEVEVAVYTTAYFAAEEHQFLCGRISGNRTCVSV